MCNWERLQILSIFERRVSDSSIAREEQAVISNISGAMPKILSKLDWLSKKSKGPLEVELTEGDRTVSIFGVDCVLTVVVEESGVENVKEHEVLEVAVAEM